MKTDPQQTGIRTVAFGQTEAQPDAQETNRRIEELTLWLYENQTFEDNSQCAFSNLRQGCWFISLP